MIPADCQWAHLDFIHVIALHIHQKIFQLIPSSPSSKQPLQISNVGPRVTVFLTRYASIIYKSFIPLSCYGLTPWRLHETCNTVNTNTSFFKIWNTFQQMITNVRQTNTRRRHRAFPTTNLINTHLSNNATLITLWLPLTIHKFIWDCYFLKK